MSHVFLTSRHAYKLKKPVRYAFLDFSTLALREQACHEEVRINQRLAPGVYLATVPLAADLSGRLRLEAQGEVQDWLVKSRRLPAERMLDSLILRGALRDDEIERLAQRLARFYRDAPRVPLSGQEYRARLAADLELSRATLLAPEFRLPVDTVQLVHRALSDFLQREAIGFDKRVEAGYLVEGHGDLRPEHVCLEWPPVVFDSLEFNARFREVDPVDELGFLAMECERLGAPQVGPIVLRVYAVETGDTPAKSLVAFYQAYRAVVRARLAILHVRELAPVDWPKWQTLTGDYLRLAARYLNIS